MGATSPSPSKCRVENKFNKIEVALPALASKRADPNAEEGKAVSASMLPSGIEHANMNAPTKQSSANSFAAPIPLLLSFSDPFSCLS